MKKNIITLSALALISLSACGTPAESEDTTAPDTATTVEAEPTPLPVFTEYATDRSTLGQKPAVDYTFDHRSDTSGYDYHLRFDGQKATLTVDLSEASDDERIDKSFELAPGDPITIEIHSASDDNPSMYNHVVTYGPEKVEKVSDTEYKVELTGDTAPSDRTKFQVQAYYDSSTAFNPRQTITFVQTGLK